MPSFSKTNPARPSGRIRQHPVPVTLRAASVVFVGALSTFGATMARAADDQAADQPAKAAELEEIVVTARYRAESLQDTPISI